MYSMESECASCGEQVRADVPKCPSCGYSPKRVLLLTGVGYFILGLLLTSFWTYASLLVIHSTPFWLFLGVLLGCLALGVHGISLFTAGTSACVDESLDDYTGVFFTF